MSPYNEAHAVCKNGRDLWILEEFNNFLLRLEALVIDGEDMTSIHNSSATDNNKQQVVQENPLANDFSDSKVELTDGLLVDKHENTAQYIVDEWEILSVEAQRKMTAPEGESDCVDSTDTKSLHSDSENEILNFPTFNPQTDGDNLILALECVFECKKDFKSAVVTHEIKNENHRFCVRHLRNNFERAGFGGFTLKKAFWDAEKATTVKESDVCMLRIRELDPNAADWLNDKEPSQWSRSHFSSDAKMLDNREKEHKWSSNDVCPNIKDILHKNQTAGGEYIPRKSYQWNYEIIGATIHDSWAVDLENKICSCRKCIMGIPCKHAIAAIRAKKDNILDYVVLISPFWCYYIAFSGGVPLFHFQELLFSNVVLF
uniref:SWIM-type domain-containing protein n=1 Tax=Solanum lycopersicum TaxID=4081 RepID=A0A3Q7FH60_SOLLC